MKSCFILVFFGTRMKQVYQDDSSFSSWYPIKTYIYIYIYMYMYSWVVHKLFPVFREGPQTCFGEGFNLLVEKCSIYLPDNISVSNPYSLNCSKAVKSSLNAFNSLSKCF